MFITLFTFSKALAAKCVSLNNEPCMIRLFLIYLNHVQLKYYPFIMSLDNHNRSCYSVNDLSMKLCVPSKTKDVKVNVFNRNLLYISRTNLISIQLYTNLNNLFRVG